MAQCGALTLVLLLSTCGFLSPVWCASLNPTKPLSVDSKFSLGIPLLGLPPISLPIFGARSPPPPALPVFPSFPPVPSFSAPSFPQPNLPMLPSFPPMAQPNNPTFSFPPFPQPTNPSFSFPPFPQPTNPTNPSFSFPPFPQPTNPTFSFPPLPQPMFPAVPPASAPTMPPPFGLPALPGFPTGIQFSFANFSQSILPQAGVKVTFSSVITVEVSLGLLGQAITEPINMIISILSGGAPPTLSLGNIGSSLGNIGRSLPGNIGNSLPGNIGTTLGNIGSSLPGSIGNTLAESKIGATCMFPPGQDGFPNKGLILVGTPLDPVHTVVTWFTLLFKGWNVQTPGGTASMDLTPGSFGAFLYNSTLPNLKVFCTHPSMLNLISKEQGQTLL